MTEPAANDYATIRARMAELAKEKQEADALTACTCSRQEHANGSSWVKDPDCPVHKPAAFDMGCYFAAPPPCECRLHFDDITGDIYRMWTLGCRAHGGVPS